MPVLAYAPIGDPAPRHRRHEASRSFSRDIIPGDYVFVQDVFGVVHVLRQEDQPGHAHHVVLGRGRAAVSAGELIMGENGVIVEVNNISGTFQCGPECLLSVIGGLIRQGAVVTDETRIEEYTP